MKILRTVTRNHVFTEIVELDANTASAIVKVEGLSDFMQDPDLAWDAITEWHTSTCDDLWENCEDTYEYRIID